MAFQRIGNRMVLKKNIFVAGSILFCATLVVVVACTGRPENNPKMPIDAKASYTRFCTQCHGDDGKLGLSGASDLSTSTLNSANTRTIIAKGRGRMLPFKNLMTKEEIHAVAAYIETLRK